MPAADLHLLIEHNPEMGINHNLLDEVTFRTMFLTTSHDRGQHNIEFNEWQDFTPVKFNSINGYTSADHTHMKSLVSKTVLWLLINVLLYLLLQVNGQHLLLSIMLGWLFTAIPYWHNFARQHNQLLEAFPENSQHLNGLDKQALEVSRQIKQAINDHPELNSQNTKLVIVGPNEFIYLRLFYHLLDYDVAVHNNLREITRITNNGLFVFFAGSNKYCHKDLENRWHQLASDLFSSGTFEQTRPTVQMLLNKPDFCLVVTQ